MNKNPALIGNCTAQRGFTLIELSIVLVIIGLIVGGVLVGRDLIAAANARSQITQLEKYQSAANAFRSKYGGLPGDLQTGGQFGFAARGQYAGEGDGNGLLEGIFADSPGMNYGFISTGGETAVFWTDLSQAKLIDAGLSLASETSSTSVCVHSLGVCSPPFIDSYAPRGKFENSFLYIMSDGNANYYFLANPILLGNTGVKINPLLTTAQAYYIDQKVDDGLPQAGRVQAQTDVQGGWACGIGYGSCSYGSCGDPPGTAVTGSSLTCYDNGGNASATMKYSVGQDNGKDINCSLSFKFQ